MKHLLKTNRNKYSSRTTIGKLDVDGIYFGYTLEDTARPFGVKVYGETCIPENAEGYKVGLHYSARFKRDMLILYTEEDKVTLKHGGISFKYIYSHGMNSHEDTLGCVGVARDIDRDKIHGSLEKPLYEKVSAWIKAGEEVRWAFINNPQES